MNMPYDKIVEKVASTLVTAGSTFTEDKKEAYRKAIAEETNPRAKWVMETILQNADAAEQQRSPLCDDTGIPHLVLDAGRNAVLTGELLDAIHQGVANGLRRLPGRPMGIMGGDEQRIDQSGGLDPDSAGVLPAPFLLRRTDGDGLKLHILMFGGGPAIRAKTLRVFHKHDTKVVLDEIVSWAKESVAQLGCTPCTLG
ncbi:MAG: fumarate hydratase, partial [Victivallales bacterium]|nr:fumarate hydratase [Victivallales bacterium]